jgi:hypothetical protein
LAVATVFLIAALAFLAFGLPRIAGASDHRWPVTAEAMRWRAPAGWLRGAFCIHRHESVDWHRAYVDWRGLPSRYSGGMQFLLDTWRRAGGKGHAWQWGPREQVYRAFVIWDKQDGILGNRRGDWSEWGTAGKCGLL